MRRVLWVLALMLVASAATAETTLKEVSWSKLKAEGKSRAGVLVAGGVPEELMITNETGEEQRLTILTIDSPGVTSLSYEITGSVRYQDVKGHAYLEMLSYFPPPNPGPYFSRTLVPGSQARQYMTGSSMPRPFSLPFMLKPHDPKPTKIELNVVMPGKGIIYLWPVKLAEGDPDSPREENLSLGKSGGREGQWWDDRAGGLIGGIFGSIIGALGGLMGTLVSRGKARVFVLAALKAEIFLGFASLTAGVVAIATQQSSAVYYPLLLCGAILLFVWIPTSPGIKRRYDELELRRISAQDAGG